MIATVSPQPVDAVWPFVLFAVFWLGIAALISLLSGWSSLARDFRMVEPVVGKRFHFASASLGMRPFRASYSGCLFVTVAENGIGISLFFLFRFFSPPLLIPWSAIESVEEKPVFLFFPAVDIRVRDHWPVLSIPGRARYAILDEYQRRKPFHKRPAH
jgi:hypothetical protein